MANGFLTGTASFVNGSKTMTLDGGVDATFVSSGSHIELNGFMTVEGMSGSVGEIQLRNNWKHATVSGVDFVITYTIEGLVDAVEKVVAISEQWGEVVETVDQITSNATGAVNTFNQLENDVDTLTTTVASFQQDIDDDKLSASTSASSANLDATKAKEYAVNPYDQNVTNTTDKSSLHHATDSLSAKVLAEGAKNDTITLKNDVTMLKSQTEDVYALAYALSDTAVDTEISSGIYSLKHYLAKTQAAAATAQAAVSSVTASLYFVGQWNAGANIAPPPPSIVDGVPQGNPMYKITVSGVIDGVDYEPNDNIIWDSQNSTHDGTNWTLEKWFKVDNSESVVSVNGKQGVVVLNIADIAGLQSAIDAATGMANSKVAQTEYDAHVSLMNVELNKMRTNLNCKLWGFII